VNDRPDAGELLAVVERFLRDELVPALDGPRRFHTRVAANVLAVVARELARGDADLRAEWAGLARLLDREPTPPADLPEALREANEELVRRIRGGEADAGGFRASLLAHLRRVVDAKLAVSVGPGASRER
jgi:hypothetical protein